MKRLINRIRESKHPSQHDVQIVLTAKILALMGLLTEPFVVISSEKIMNGIDTGEVIEALNKFGVSTQTQQREFEIRPNLKAVVKIYSLSHESAEQAARAKLAALSDLMRSRQQNGVAEPLPELRGLI